MPQELTNILISAAGIAITALAAWGMSVFTAWLNTKIKDKKLKELVNKVLNIISDAVKQIYQEYVEALKLNGGFTEEAQKEAKEKAIQIIKNQLTPELVTFIKENYGDMEVWIANKIEVVLYNLKNK